MCKNIKWEPCRAQHCSVGEWILVQIKHYTVMSEILEWEKIDVKPKSILF